MRQLLILTALVAVCCNCAIVQAEAPCPIIPTPKVYRDLGHMLTLDTSGNAAIVVGQEATEPERYAAEYLQTQIERRYKHKLAILDEDAVLPTISQVLLLGQVDTNSWLNRLCREHKLDLSTDSPGHDGFIIRCLEDGPRQIVLIGGNNPRGVIYGQHAFFDLLRQEAETVLFPAVSVRDWPSIPWRGRPHSVLKQHLVPGALDAYLRARLNFTDVRDDPDVEPTIIFPARKASMGLPAGKPIDRPLVERMIRESHRRGLFVYGTVSCGVPAEKTGDVIKTFEELIALGVDGLWISFDDVGAGENAANVVHKVLELGARHQMTGRKIAVTPPSGDYQYIDTEFNRQAASSWGLADAQWLFTRVPCADDLKMARQIGISGLPGWWHNLVDMRGGFLHNGDVLCPLRKDWKPAYVNPQPLTNGWLRPTYEQLRDAEKYTSCVLLWGVIGGWPEEYQLGDLGRWSWDPATYDWTRSCDAAYRLLYGQEQVEIARTFDAKLSALKDLFHLPPWRFWPQYNRSFTGWPCRLKHLEDRPKALALLDELEALAKKLSQEAGKQTAIDPTRLETIYLAPMHDTLDYARRMTLLDYPEYTTTEREQTMIPLILAGKLTEANDYLAAERPHLDESLQKIETELAALKQVEEYVAMWRQRLSGLDYWKDLAVRRTVEKGIQEGYYAGAVVLAGRSDRILMHEAFGHAQLQPAQIPMRKDSIFDLASVTKVVATATACAVCVDEGLVDLDKPARQYLSDLSGKGVELVTVRQLGSHTSGFDNTKFTPRYQGDAMLSAMLAASPHDPPGSRFQYSCLNFILLSMLVEEAAKQPFSTFCENRIFSPLGMKDTRFGPVPPGRRVVAMKEKTGQISDMQARLAGKPVGNAGLFSTAADLARFCRMMLGEGKLGDTRILSQSIVQKITHDASASKVGRGFGWDLRPEGRPRGLSDATYYHTGWTGQSLWIDPKSDLYVIVLTNRNHPKEKPSLYDKAKQFRIHIAEVVLNELGSGLSTDPE